VHIPTPPIRSIRGKIIKRSDRVHGNGRSPCVGSSTRVASSRESLNLRTAGSVLCSFVVTPVVFVVCAAYMWSQPLGEGDREVSKPPRGRASTSQKFKDLGAEYTRLSNVEGIKISSPPRSTSIPDVKHLPPAPVRAEVQLKTPRPQLLEKKVFAILQKHGRPVQKGELLAKAIVQEALSQGYDPLFVAAVIKSESAFNSLARSHKGAQGLMQLMPKTGAWLADQGSIPRGRLTDPGHNLKLGITYLKQLESEYGGNRVLTLVAYNWGPGHVASASLGRRRIPGEVMQYAVKILNDYRRWHGELGSYIN
jgi:hypothetical protein